MEPDPTLEIHSWPGMVFRIEIWLQEWDLEPLMEPKATSEIPLLARNSFQEWDLEAFLEPDPTPETHSWPGVGFRSGIWNHSWSQIPLLKPTPG